MKDEIFKKFTKITDDGEKILVTPFAVSKEKKTAFFHIAKTGGSAIHKILREEGYDDGILSNKKLCHEKKLDYFQEVVENWEDYYTFTFIRNKFSQMVSLWNYDSTNHRNFSAYGKEYQDKALNDFGFFIKHFVMPSNDLYAYWIDQYYLTTVDSSVIFDFVGRQEDFKNDIEVAMKEIGIKNYNADKRINDVGYKNKKHFSKYYDKNIEALVRKKFKKEIDYFGFSIS